MLTDRVSRFSAINFPSFALAAYRAIFFTLAAIVLLSRVAAAPVSHDEYQFVASGQWFARALLLPYVDYTFLHMPYQVVVNGLAVALSSYDYLGVRAVNAGFHLASALLLFGLVSHGLPGCSPQFRSLAGSLAAAFFLFDPTLITMDGRALNHALPVALSLLSFAFYRRASADAQALAHSQAARWLFFSGLAGGLAAGVRLSFAVVAAPFLALLALEWLRRTQPDPLRRLAWYLAGLLLALLPVGLLFLAAPAPFTFGNYVYVRMNTLYRQGVGFETSMDLPSKLAYFFEMLRSYPLSLLLYLLLIMVSVIALARFWRRNEPPAAQALLAALLAWAFLAAGFAPTPLWPQYFFAPVPFLLLAAAYGLGWLPNRQAQWSAAAGVGLLFLITFPFSSLANNLVVFRQPDQWVPIQVHRFASEIQQFAPSGNVLTLAPIFPLEAGLGAYPDLIVGPFAWRTAPLLSAEGRRRYQLVSFHELDELLAQSPPAAILTGVETDYGFDRFDTKGLEAPLIDYAVRHGYQPLHHFQPPFWATQITLWVQPD